MLVSRREFIHACAAAAAAFGFTLASDEIVLAADMPALPESAGPRRLNSLYVTGDGTDTPAGFRLMRGDSTILDYCIHQRTQFQYIPAPEISLWAHDGRLHVVADPTLTTYIFFGDVMEVWQGSNHASTMRLTA